MVAQDRWVTGFNGVLSTWRSQKSNYCEVRVQYIDQIEHGMAMHDPPLGVGWLANNARVADCPDFSLTLEIYALYSATFAVVWSLRIWWALSLPEWMTNIPAFPLEEQCPLAFWHVLQAV